jgi:hypothetical protein
MASYARVTIPITAQNTFTPTLKVAGKKTLNLSIYSTALNATIVLQRRWVGDTNWNDIASYTANVEKIVESVGTWEYRAGVKTGGFTSATALNVSLAF